MTPDPVSRQEVLAIVERHKASACNLINWWTTGVSDTVIDEDDWREAEGALKVCKAILADIQALPPATTAGEVETEPSEVTARCFKDDWSRP